MLGVCRFITVPFSPGFQGFCWNKGLENLLVPYISSWFYAIRQGGSPQIIPRYLCLHLAEIKFIIM